jgi:hypothetical protein
LSRAIWKWKFAVRSFIAESAASFMFRSSFCFFIMAATSCLAASGSQEIIARISSGPMLSCAAGLFVSRFWPLMRSAIQPALPSIKPNRIESGKHSTM